jgi:hypothetical protein
MIRRLLAGILLAGLLLLIGAPAHAEPPVTTTTHEKNLVENFVDFLPTCEGGPEYTITATSNLVSHETVFIEEGRSHGTFTQTGTFVAEPLDDPNLPSFTGKFTILTGFNLNGKTETSRTTITVHGTGSDGSTFQSHRQDRFNIRPDGSINEVFGCHE